MSKNRVGYWCAIVFGLSVLAYTILNYDTFSFRTLLRTAVAVSVLFALGYWDAYRRRTKITRLSDYLGSKMRLLLFVSINSAFIITYFLSHTHPVIVAVISGALFALSLMFSDAVEHIVSRIMPPIIYISVVFTVFVESVLMAFGLNYPVVYLSSVIGAYYLDWVVISRFRKSYFALTAGDLPDVPVEMTYYVLYGPFLVDVLFVSNDKIHSEKYEKNVAHDAWTAIRENHRSLLLF